MYKLRCEECNSVLIFDEQLTKEFIWSCDNIMYSEENGIIEDTLRSEIAYRCSGCEKVYQLNYKEWESLARKQMSQDVMEIKCVIAFKTANISIVDEDDKLVFCGYCSGYDNLGHCFTTIIDKCKLRKDKVKKDEL